MPEEGSPWIELVPSIGASGLLSLVLVLIFTGRLIPSKLVLRSEMEAWRDAALEYQRQNQQLLQAGTVTQDVLRSLDQESQR